MSIDSTLTLTVLSILCFSSLNILHTQNLPRCSVLYGFGTQLNEMDRLKINRTINHLTEIIQWYNCVTSVEFNLSFQFVLSVFHSQIEGKTYRSPTASLTAVQ